MKLFENLFGKKDNNVTKEIAEKYMKLFSLFDEKDGTSDAEFLLKRMLQSPRDYFKDNKFRYEPNEITEDAGLDDLVWFLFADILAECSIVSEVDYDCDLDFFRFSMDRIDYKGIFDLSEEQFDPNGKVADWIKLLQEQAQSQDECIATLEREGDHYMIFLTDKDTLKEMREIGLELNRYIKIFE